MFAQLEAGRVPMITRLYLEQGATGGSTGKETTLLTNPINSSFFVLLAQGYQFGRFIAKLHKTQPPVIQLDDASL